jgi:hypothetical protein
MPFRHVSHRPPPALATSLTFAAAMLLGGCKGYEKRTDPAFSDFRRGEFHDAIGAYEDEETTGSPFLSGAEAGTKPSRSSVTRPSMFARSSARPSLRHRSLGSCYSPGRSPSEHRPMTEKATSA